jgi:hypothetical protein
MGVESLGFEKLQTQGSTKKRKRKRNGEMEGTKNYIKTFVVKVVQTFLGLPYLRS